MFRTVLTTATLIALTVGGGVGLSYAHSNTMFFGELAGDVDTRPSELPLPAVPSGAVALSLDDLTTVPVHSTVTFLDEPAVIQTTPPARVAALDEALALPEITSDDPAVDWSVIPGPRPSHLDLAGRRTPDSKRLVYRAPAPKRALPVATKRPNPAATAAPVARAVRPSAPVAAATGTDLVVVTRNGRRFLAKPNADRSAVMLQSAPRYSVGVYR